MIRFLILPTAFDKDAQLRFADGIITIVVVALLTGGYSLSALLWFACPSILFRLECIFIPTASACAFGFFAIIWTLISSPRFDATQPACPVSIVLTVLSFTIYCSFAIWLSQHVKKITNPPPWPLSGAWQDNSSAYSSSYPLRSHSEINSINYIPTNDIPPPVIHEEDPVGQQFTHLLANPNPIPSPEAARETFNIEFPPGGDDDDDAHKRARARTLSGSHLSPNDAIRHGRHNSDSGGALSRIGRAIGLGDRGRTANREEQERNERARSREERRRQIEMGPLAPQ